MSTKTTYLSVDQSSEDKMLKVIQQHRENELLGSTSEGRDFCLRALYPAAEKIDSPGIPDEFSGNVSIMKYNQVAIFDYATAFPSGTATSWDVEVLLFKNPVILGCVKMTSAGSVQYSPIYNTAISPYALPASYSTRYSLGWMSAVNSYRCVYSACTAHLDAPATASQGTIVAAQYQDYPRRLQNFFYQAAASSPTNLSFPAQVYGSYKTYDSLMIMPGAFSVPAVMGCYMPLILDDFSFKDPTPMWQFFGDALTAVSLAIQTDVPVAVPPAFNAGFPYGSNGYFGTASCGNSTLVPPRSGESVGHMVFKGISPSAKIVLTLRNGYEVQLPPGNQFNMFQRVSPRIDPLALQSYQVVRRELASAYPESYNSLGALLSTIAGLASTYVPQLISWIQGKIKARREQKAQQQKHPVVQVVPAAQTKKKHVPPSVPPPKPPKKKSE